VRNFLSLIEIPFYISFIVDWLTQNA